MNNIGPVAPAQIWFTFASLASFFISAISLVIAFVCIVSLEGKIKSALKLFALVIFLRIVFKGLGIIGFSASPFWSGISAILHTVIDIALLLGFIVMYRLETSIKKK